jgi:hypothetical protein
MGRRTPCIADIDGPPVVGRHYLVPHIFYWWGTSKAHWWPVIGPKHDDAEHLNVEQPHYHVDLRFLSPRRFRDRNTSRRDCPIRYQKSRYTHLAGGVIAAFPPNGLPLDAAGKGGPLPEPVLRRARCNVADAGFPPLSRALPQFMALHAAYEGKRCGRDAQGRLVCPHKGAALSNLAPDLKGRVTCPLHGLVVNVETGVVEKRPVLPKMVW